MTSDDYAFFAVSTAQEIVKEEDERLQDEIHAEISALMDVWIHRVAERITARMEAVGIAQVLEIESEWDANDMPSFKYKGATHVGSIDHE